MSHQIAGLPHVSHDSLESLTGSHSLISVHKTTFNNVTNFSSFTTITPTNVNFCYVAELQLKVTIKIVHQVSVNLK